MHKLIPWWFPERLPSEQLLENKFKSIISWEFQKYWFVNIATPAVERNEVLTAKSWSDASQQIYWLHGLAQVQQWKNDYKNYSLRFDLTVPMSRYVLDHAEDLAFPFKRYQIQKVWRGESAQRWRYKEFYQCDVDVVDKTIDIKYDAETIEVLAKTLQKVFHYFDIEADFTIQLNNRKIYDAIFEDLAIDTSDRWSVMNMIDSYYKIGIDNFSRELEAKIGEHKSKKLQRYLDYSIENLDSQESSTVQEAKKELKTVYDLLSRSWIKVAINPYIVRGLDYYTWTVFETFIDDHPEFWSICSGWRYDNLSKHITDATWHKGENYEGVGWSIWLSRLLWRLLDAWMIHHQERLVDVMFFNIAWQATYYKQEIASILRNEGITTTLYHKDDKLGKQFTYAEKLWIPLGIFLGEQEEKTKSITIRNLSTKENKTMHIQNHDYIDYIKSVLEH